VRELLAVRHNIEVAHRLFLTPGKCQQIHGHSMWVTLEVEGQRDATGKVGGLDFATMKTAFRGYLDATFDHRLLLHHDDPFARALDTDSGTNVRLPGLLAMDDDPTTENIAAQVFTMMWARFPTVYAVDVEETSVNRARVQR
jgi:6-pyruvoyltetrahydropterin/6-carboxytetrahydropterin synthase